MDPILPAPLASTPPAAPLPEPKSKIWVWILAGVLLLGVGIISGVFLGKQFYSQNTAQINSYDQCVAANGSRIQESYPATCVTAAGQSFVQPVSAPTIAENTQEIPVQASWSMYEGKYFSISQTTKWEFISRANQSPATPEVLETAAFTNNQANLNIQVSTNPVEKVLASQDGEISGKVTLDNIAFTKKAGYGGIAGSVYSVSLVGSNNEKTFLLSYYTQDSQNINNYNKDFDQILSTFKFIDGNGPAASLVSSAKKLTYQLPNGWQTIEDNTSTFDVGFDPNTQDGNPNTDLAFSNAVTLTDKNLNNAPYYSPYSSSIFLWLLPYDGGSRHTFFETAILKEKLSMHNQGSREKEYLVQGKNCLVFYKLRDLSQGHTTIGMCPINNSQALVFSSFFEEIKIEAMLQTLRFFK